MASIPASDTAVQTWFGPAFRRLHPMLQQLHRDGGAIGGPVAICLGTGLAERLGRLLATRLGIPVSHPTATLTVHVSHHDQQLIWARRFVAPDGAAHALVSTFTAHGSYPTGYWEEHTGAMRFRLGVVISEGGGWRWQVRRAWLHGVPLPVALFPRSDAAKSIEDGAYRFLVRFAMPGFGLLLSYGGLLHRLAFASPADSPPR
jgi:hypothetical protein